MSWLASIFGAVLKAILSRLTGRAERARQDDIATRSGANEVAAATNEKAVHVEKARAASNAQSRDRRSVSRRLRQGSI